MRTRHRMRACKPKRAQQGFALLSAVVFLVVLLATGATMIQHGMQDMYEASRAKKETRAFQLAEAGVDYAAWQLYNNPSTILPASWTRTDMGDGTFTVTAEAHDDCADAIVLTSIGDSQGWEAEVKVVGQFLQAGGGGQNAVFDHALFSDADLTLSGNFNVEGDVHANGKATLKGNPSVDGDVTAVGSINVKGNPDVSGDVTGGVAQVEMPTVDLEYYHSIATDIYSDGHTFSGNTSLSGVVYVEGDAHINGNFSGTGVIVVEEDVHINGNATVEAEGDEFAIVSCGTVRVNGNCTIEGWVYTHNVDVPGLFRGNGNADIIGGVAADRVNCNGNMDITYSTPTVDLPGSSSAPAQFDGISWRRIR